MKPLLVLSIFVGAPVLGACAPPWLAAALLLAILITVAGVKWWAWRNGAAHP